VENRKYLSQNSRSSDGDSNPVVGSYRYTNLLSKIMISLDVTGSFDISSMIKQGDPTTW
jgi:hypothetical protein